MKELIKYELKLNKFYFIALIIILSLYISSILSFLSLNSFLSNEFIEYNFDSDIIKLQVSPQKIQNVTKGILIAKSKDITYNIVLSNNEISKSIFEYESGACVKTSIEQNQAIDFLAYSNIKLDKNSIILSKDLANLLNASIGTNVSYNNIPLKVIGIYDNFSENEIIPSFIISWDYYVANNNDSVILLLENKRIYSTISKLIINDTILIDNEGIFQIFKAILATKCIILANIFVLIIFMILTLINFINVLFNKKEKHNGILITQGLNKTDFNIINFVIFFIIAIFSYSIGIIISLLINLYMSYLYQEQFINIPNIKIPLLYIIILLIGIIAEFFIILNTNSNKLYKKNLRELL